MEVFSNIQSGAVWCVRACVCVYLCTLYVHVTESSPVCVHVCITEKGVSGMEYTTLCSLQGIVTIYVIRLNTGVLLFLRICSLGFMPQL